MSLRRVTVNRRPYIVLNICMLIAILGSSIVGAQIGPISLNKIGLIPLLIYLLAEYLAAYSENHSGISIRFMNQGQVWWYVIGLISSVIGLFRFNIGREFVGYYSNLINYLIQIIIFYIPLLLLTASYKRKDVLLQAFKTSLLLTCRIQMIWAFLQFVLYTGIHFDLNKEILVNTLGGLGRDTWTVFLWDYGAPVLRISGLNYDGAFLGYILLIGFIFDDNKIMKVAYTTTILLSLQRSALLGLVLVIMYITMAYLIKVKNSLKPIRYTVVSIALIVIFIIVLDRIPIVNDYFTKFMARFDFLQANALTNLSSSSSRHILYLPYSVKTLFSIDPIVFILGIGPRASGVALTLNIQDLKALTLDSNMVGASWAIECDFAEILLGTGILGAIAYYWGCYLLYRQGNLKIRAYIIALIGVGLMYDFSHLTITHMLLTFMYLFVRYYTVGKPGIRIHTKVVSKLVI